MYWLIGRYAIVGVVGLAIGWSVNGWRLEAKIASLKQSYAEATAERLQFARDTEKRLTSEAENIRRDRDAKVKDLNSRLNRALSELQQRQKRDTSGANSAATCSGATGANLSKEDAEFLARLAAEADTVVEQLNYCVNQYNSLRK